jgi:hypothetical protein
MRSFDVGDARHTKPPTYPCTPIGSIDDRYLEGLMPRRRLLYSGTEFGEASVMGNWDIAGAKAGPAEDARGVNPGETQELIIASHVHGAHFKTISGLD